MNIKDLCQCLYHYGDNQNPMIEQQIEQRLELVQFWKVRPGQRVLEIGCGEGIMTVALAAAVEDQGRITAVDIDGREDWDDPPLGTLVDYVNDSILGPRIEFMLSTDVLSPDIDLCDWHFDLVVFNQCSWYFSELDLLRRLFAQVHRWSARLGYHEWDVVPDAAGQVPHMLSALLQAQLANLGFEVGNVRSIVLPGEGEAMAVAAGWEIIDRHRLESSRSMPDGINWEPYLGAEYAERSLTQPDRFPSPNSRALVSSQLDMLTLLNERIERQSLMSQAFLAERSKTRKS